MARLPGQLTVATVGRLRTPHWQAAQNAYLARLKRYIQVAVVEVRDAVGSSLPDEVAVAREGEALLKAVDGVPWVLSLDPTGRQADSVRFAHYLRQQIEVYHHLGFVIGGPVGLSSEVSERANERFSLSLLTFPHELARIVLLEQLYRAMTILSGEPYHK